jgi:hypothetical protein
MPIYAYITLNLYTVEAIWDSECRQDGGIILFPYGSQISISLEHLVRASVYRLVGERYIDARGV